MNAPSVSVACNGCTACCRGEAIFLQPDDNPLLFETVEVYDPTKKRFGRMLKQTEDLACIYLGDGGCTIHERRPIICRVFDCAAMVAKLIETYPRAERRRMLRDGRIDAEVYDAGSSRMAKP